ncbi:hypothetical protein IOF35_001438 [Campylobacter coli]|nr:hypothetical protein [Campylobacter coli]
MSQKYDILFFFCDILFFRRQLFFFFKFHSFLYFFLGLLPGLLLSLVFVCLIENYELKLKINQDKSK